VKDNCVPQSMVVIQELDATANNDDSNPRLHTNIGGEDGFVIDENDEDGEDDEDNDIMDFDELDIDNL